jgi:predicted Fe-Mo cluster-binding NifX family protein
MRTHPGEGKERPRPVRVASDTRQWTSGVVRFSVITIEGHPASTYVLCEKIVVGRSLHSGGFQQFRFRLRDWNNLKRLIEQELAEKHGWLLQQSGLQVVPTAQEDVVRFLEEHPGLLEKLLDLPNLRTLSRESFEALNRLGMKVYVVQSRHLETILEKLSRASEQEFVQFANLLRDMRIGQVATLANLIRQKLQIISLFKALTSSSETLEGAIHELIENNIWIADKRYEIVASDETLARYLHEHVGLDPELKKRPDLIVKRVPYEDRIVLIELKRPGVDLRPAHVGQILEYKGLIKQYRPNAPAIDCYLFGYRRHASFVVESADVNIATFSELVTALEDEYREYLRALEASGDELPTDEDDHCRKLWKSRLLKFR